MANKSVNLEVSENAPRNSNPSYNISDINIAYDDFTEYFYGQQGNVTSYGPDNIAGSTKVNAKVIISQGKDVNRFTRSNIGYGLNPLTTKALNMKEKIGKPFSGSTKSAWMNDKLPKGVQTSFQKYFKNTNLRSDEPSTTNNAFLELVKKGVK